ncbi:TPA: DNA polymerase III subunit alpha [Clostridium botulinum]|nr:DNA polymerase III subunit alpha [Clostridium botulinum]
MKIISNGVRDLIRNICEEAKIKGKEADINFLVELHLVKEKVEVIYNGAKIDTLPVIAFKNLFARRNKFYAVAKDNMLGEIEVVRYANLHQHTCYSILDGMGKIPDIVQKTEWSSAITDHGVMYGMVQFYKEMKSYGKKPIIGFEAYTESIDGQKEKNHLVLLARNNKGLKNLIKLTSLGFTNFYKKPQLSYDMLRHHSEGVIATSACLGGEIPRALINGNEDLAYKIANELIAIFGKENFFIEIQRHNIAVEEKLNEQLLEMAKKLGVKAIATADSHYVEKEDAYIHEIQLCMQTKKTMNDPTRWRFPGEGYHVHTSGEMEELFNDLPELLDNTLDLVESIDCELELGNVYMPSFPVPEGFKDEEEYFIQLCWEGFDKRFKGTKKDNKEYRERLEFEIGVINKMGFPGYFVIVWDFIRFAKERKILVGPGRGSACGSLVAYCLEITNLDPIKYGLLFERFLNVDRVSMPDYKLIA